MDIKGKNILQLQEMMKTEKLTSLELTMWYLDRINSYDQSGCMINSVTELNPDALLFAQAMDRERKEKGPRGPMHGIPVLLKDNISTGDKMHTTAGSVALADNFAKDDAAVVKKLRSEGAVILGKTNMSEFARYMAVEFSNGYSSRGGQVKNPYGEQFDVSGSSSGSAAAVSCDFCAVAVGTETAGSITCPAMNNGIVGIKPTVGLISRSGIIPICNQDTAGPLGRTVSDCAVLLGAMVTGEDPHDAATTATEAAAFRDYTQFLNPDGLRGMRIGVNRIRCEAELFPEECEEIFERELKRMEEAGAVLVDSDIEYTGLEDGIMGQATLHYEFKTAINDYLIRYGNSGCKSLKDIIEYNKAHSDIALRFGQDLLESAQNETGGRLLEKIYWQAKLSSIEKGGTEGIDKMLREKNLDVIVSACYSNLPPVTGYPVIAVPMGFSNEGMPVGLSFYAGAFQEAAIIKAAYGYEQITSHRKEPKLD